MKVSLTYIASLIVLAITVLVIAFTLKEPPLLIDIKRRYRVLLAHLRDTKHRSAI